MFTYFFRLCSAMAFQVGSTVNNRRHMELLTNASHVGFNTNTAVPPVGSNTNTHFNLKQKGQGTFNYANRLVNAGSHVRNSSIARYYNNRNYNSNRYAAQQGRRSPPEQCKICSFKQPKNKRPVFHRHHSAREIRRLAGAEGNMKEFNCDTCGTVSGEKKTRGRVHAIGQDARLNICISSSTLHNFWLDPSYEGDDVHIDWVTCPGAKIQDLADIWKVEYGKERRPMDILVVGGLNNCKLEDKDMISEYQARYTQQHWRFKGP